MNDEYDKYKEYEYYDYVEPQLQEIIEIEDLPGITQEEIEIINSILEDFDITERFYNEDEKDPTLH